MSRRSLFLIAPVAAWLLGLSNGSAQLELLSTNVAPVFRTEIRPGETVGTEQIRRAFISVGTNQFMLRIPTGFQLNASDAERIVLSHAESGQFIAIQLIRPAKSAIGETQRPDWKAEALNVAADATVVDEHTEFALGAGGPAYDLRWKVAGADQMARVAYIPTKVGVMEFKLITPAKSFDVGRMILTIVLTSLQSNEQGPIVVRPLLGYS